VTKPESLSRIESLRMWEAIAAGEHEPRLAAGHVNSADDLERLMANHNSEYFREWLSAVAKRVIEADREPPGAQRDRAIVRALGLSGPADIHCDLRNVAHRLYLDGASRSEIVDAILTGTWRGLTITGYDFSAYSPLEKSRPELAKIVDAELTKARRFGTRSGGAFYDEGGEIEPPVTKN
jgi:hypothetical protein